MKQECPTSAGMNYRAVSDLNLAELQQFVQLLQDNHAALRFQIGISEVSEAQVLSR